MTDAQAIGIAKNAQVVAKKAEDIAHEAHTMAQVLDAKQEAHEKTCGIRYAEIITLHSNTNNEIKSAKNYLIGLLITMVLGMAGVIFTNINT